VRACYETRKRNNEAEALALLTHEWQPLTRLGYYSVDQRAIIGRLVAAGLAEMKKKRLEVRPGRPVVCWAARLA